MIRHICMFTLKEDKAANAAEFVLRAQSLRAIPSVRAFSVVTNDPATPKTNYDVSLIIDFDDVAGLTAYQVSPEHVAFGQFVGTIRIDRACIDYAF
ncbi:MAG: Dabb family protein [Clostridia bacterium]|nr:Dabb family protein [Clostridia bacterium]